MEADTHGIEGTVNWDVTDFWNLVAGYSFFEVSYDYDETIDPSLSEQALEKVDPKHKASLLSYVNLPHHIEFDTALYYVERFSLLSDSEEIPAYFRFDARLGWRPIKTIDLSIVLQNAFDDQHQEYSEGVIKNSEIQRSIFGKITWQL